jgi:rod shape-determining protein MreC
MRRKSKFFLPARYLLLIMSGVCIIIMLLSFTLNISGGPLNAAAGYVFVPMQEGINKVGTWISDKAANLKNLSDVMAENEDLQNQVDELTTELNTIKLEQYELDNLRELYNLDQKYPSYEKVAANVIGKNSGNWFNTFTIDKGSNDGIEVDMNVMAGSGLVGIVTDVGPNYAKVTSIINDTSKVSGMVTTTSDNLIVSGSLQKMNEDMVIEFNNLNDKDNEVSINDPVVTSAVSYNYQQGILIGYISSIETDSNNLTKSGTITPAVDFEHIEEVLVILNKKQTVENSIREDDMRRKITVFLIIAVCYLLQSTVFQALSFASISPNLMIVVVSAFGFMRGKKEGLWIGFFTGLLLDIFTGSILGFYALLYMYVGYFNGFFRKMFYPEDIKLPMLLIAVSDFSCSLIIYFLLFLFRGKFDILYYLLNIMIPELVYTMVVTIFLYFIILKINQKLETIEKRSAVKFV